MKELILIDLKKTVMGNTGKPTHLKVIFAVHLTF
jgi:hypothetical protein